MNKHLIALTAAFVLAACSSGVPKPQTLPQLQSGGGWFQLEQRDAEGNAVQSSLLAVEQGAEGVRFVQTDPLGAPLSRQVLSKKGWRNDGFVMPNASARRLFAAMLPLFAADGAAVYPDLQRSRAENGECFSQKGRTLWCSAQTGNGWLVTFPDQTKWSVVPIRD